MMKEGGACGCGGDCGGSCGGKSCGCIHHKMVPLMITLIGLVFLAKAMMWVSVATADWVWPILLIIAGLTKMYGSKCKCCR